MIKGQSIGGEFRAKVKVSEQVQGKAVVREVSSFSTVMPAIADQTLMPDLTAHNVEVTATSTEPSFLVTVLISLAPWLIIIGIWWFGMRAMRSQGPGGMLGGFANSGARTYTTQEKVTVTFEDVAGMENSKQELKEIVDYLRNPKQFERIGGKVPKGVLLVGPPGTGKTLLARAVAGEAGVTFFTISASQFIEMFVGVGASRVRDLFTSAKKAAPSIIFIDELDAVGRSRGAGFGGGHDEREQTLNQLLSEMDGFDQHQEVIVLAATNRPDVLDPALLRPGRFDRHVVIERPDWRDREKILQVHVRKIAMAEGLDLSVVARGTPGMTGADLENLVNEAAILASRENAATVTMEHLEKAKDKILMGGERKMFITPEEKRITAYHEAGHTLVARLLPGTDPIHKVTIIPRGMALGSDPAAPRGRPLPLSAQLPGEAAGSGHGWAGSGAAGVRRGFHRRPERPEDGHRTGGEDGLPVGNERKGRGHDFQPGRGTPLPRDETGRGEDLLGGHGLAHRPGDRGLYPPGGTAGRRAVKCQPRQAGSAGGSAAGGGDAGRSAG